MRQITAISVTTNDGSTVSATRHINHPTRPQWWLNYRTTRPEPHSPNGKAITMGTAFFRTLPEMRREIAKRFPGSKLHYLLATPLRKVA